MIFSPLPGTPTVTQGFGQNKEIYQQYGWLGHNGFDFGVPEDTKIFAPHDGVVTVKDDGATGYGKYVVIDGPTRRSVLAHCSQVTVKNGQPISQGDPVALSGNTGSSTGPHLHWTFKLLKNGVVQNKENGYDGAMDCSEVTRLWQQQNLHQHAQFTPAAQPYLSMTFAANQVIKNTTGA
ncbi:MAG TPA: hypothetical protein DEB30_03715 [Candidatus Peribacter riflensis]|uniref:Peptidase M23 family protein n=1 Tax=Candidatus Peribacter riflensis TaxID=1735162 RepID=A0A0S1SHE4_9BACT|nr:MAG: peptidase M23 family protein [Candidatus Peribacter riflensis]OGJ79017.1 MAG: hypothetical protein A2398_04950 [Candidatus Peribacteria bacterium RIFOXYB1_FULL_57_12]OGJ80203.1 MAG: hypothetical protein A2412_04605 [Candidatus Peribacteria bacterium RIFOXYC1_FULL_58_8]ALM11167.1 MAG: peptidase M23 family protein [Candidatus Peribacter riflensis]ALM12270.1 MAG: peptidase M23 family protein [Candidatus Peribacter riflensis]